MEEIVGIDLGTTNSCVSIWRNGKLEIITDEFGNKTIPSIITFANDNRFVGTEAKNNFSPKNTFYNIKRLIGNTYDNKIVQHNLKLSTFDHYNSNNSILLKHNNKTYNPEELSAMVLSKLKLMANKYLNTNITKAIITIPAYFNDAQRQATKDAAKIAGLQVVRLLNEPTAAAIAYGLSLQKDIEKNVIIFDLGGGTLDVSLLNMQEGIFQVKAISGNCNLGGCDFDQRLVNYCLYEFCKKNMIEYSKINNENIVRLNKAAEHCKRILTNNEKHTIFINNFYNNLSLNIEISRDKFNELCNDLFILCLKYIDDVLNDSKLDKNDIDDIVLVGGSTRMLRIQEVLQTMFKNKTLNRSINPDEVVAAGAALQAYKLSHPDDPFSNDIVLLDVIPLTLGIETMEEIMTPIIPRNTPIPVKKTKKFTTNDKNTIVKVFEGERRLTKDNYLVGSFELLDLQTNPEIDITYHVDINGIINVKAVEKKGNVNKEIKIIGDKGRLSEDEINRLIKEASDNEIYDKIICDKTQLIYDINNLCKNIVSNINSPETKLPDKDDILNYINTLQIDMSKDINELSKIKSDLLANYGSINNVVQNSEYKGTNIYDENDYDVEKDELKQTKEALIELCDNLYSYVEDKKYIEDIIKWINNDNTINELKDKINELNNFTKTIVSTKDELHFLCSTLLQNIEDGDIILNKEDLDKLEDKINNINIENMDDDQCKNTIKEINDYCNYIAQLNENDEQMGTKIDNINKIDENIDEIILEIQRMENNNILKKIDF